MVSKLLQEKQIPSNSILKSHMKILSWNIQSSKSSSINKFNDPDFTSILSGHDIICLQEIRQAIKLPGFRALCNLREGQKYGGVGILFRNEFLGGIQLIPNPNTKDIITCKLSKSFFNLKSDIYIINVYITPFNSPAKTLNGKDLLHKVENIVNNLQAKGDILICGDFNSRIADNPGLSEHEDETLLCSSDRDS